MTFNDMITKLVEADNAYYNSGKPTMSDAKYDLLRKKAKRLDPKHQYFKRVGAKPHGQEVTLPETMGSLNKIRPVEVLDFVAPLLKKRTDLIITPKLDGLSIKLHYKNGLLQAAYTRGDGVHGRDVTRFIKLCKCVPLQAFPGKGDVYVNGEVIIFKSIFRKMVEAGRSKYNTTRNFVGGVLNRKELDDKTRKDLKRIAFIAYHISGDFNLTKIEMFHLMRTFGFVTADMPFLPLSETAKAKIDYLNSEKHTIRSGYYKGRVVVGPVGEKLMAVIDGFLNKKRLDAYRHIALPVFVPKESENITVKNIKLCIKKYAEWLDIDIDGIVIEPNNPQVLESFGRGSDGLTLKGMVAVKLDAEEQNAQLGIVNQEEWNYTKRGVLKPTLVLRKPLDFKGAKVSRIFGHNAKTIKDMGIGAGATIRVVRSGDVIPYLVGVKHKATVKLPTKCPFCKSKLQWTDVDLYCANDDCKGKVEANTRAFFEIIHPDNVGTGVIDIIMAAGHKTVPQILALSIKQLAKIDGFGNKRARIVHDNIALAVKDLPLSTLMHASNMFADASTSLGETILQRIVDSFGARRLLKSKPKQVKRLVRLLEKLGSVGPNAVKHFNAGLPKFLAWYGKIKPYVKVELEKVVVKGSMTGQVCCFTGFRDKKLAAEIVSKGGVVTDTWSSKVTVLFAASESTKTKKAVKAKVKVVAMGDVAKWMKQWK